MNRIAAWVITLLITVFGIPFMHIFQTHRGGAGTATPRPAPQMSAWLASFNEDQAYAGLTQHAGKLSAIMPVWYAVNPDATVEPLPTITRRADILKLSADNKLPVLPNIGNDFDPARISALLASNDKQQTAINSLLTEAQTNHYAGWDIDWEQLNPSDRQSFTAFIQRLALALHQQHLVLSIDVPVPATKADGQVQAFDLPRLARSADQIRVMAYDYHNGSSDPGPVTPLDSYETTLKAVTKSVPSSKLVIGLPTYGYDWNLQTNKGEPVQFDEATSLAAAKHFSFDRDQASSALTGHYSDGGVDHVVWLNDAVALKAQEALAQTYGLYQFSIWRLGGEDPGLW